MLTLRKVGERTKEKLPAFEDALVVVEGVDVSVDVPVAVLDDVAETDAEDSASVVDCALTLFDGVANADRVRAVTVGENAAVRERDEQLDADLMAVRVVLKVEEPLPEPLRLAFAVSERCV